MPNSTGRMARVKHRAARSAETVGMAISTCVTTTARAIKRVAKPLCAYGCIPCTCCVSLVYYELGQTKKGGKTSDRPQVSHRLSDL
ncbi:hypothetical protein OH77DRAFT_1424210, partial [Trametes cingulata]